MKREQNLPPTTSTNGKEMYLAKYSLSVPLYHS